MFLTITTSSGWRGVRSTGRVVAERGDKGVKSPNDPNAPKSELANVELHYFSQGNKCKSFTWRTLQESLSLESSCSCSSFR